MRNTRSTLQNVQVAVRITVDQLRLVAFGEIDAVKTEELTCMLLLWRASEDADVSQLSEVEAVD